MENQSEKLDHQVAGLPSLRLASSRIQFSVHTKQENSTTSRRSARILAPPLRLPGAGPSWHPKTVPAASSSAVAEKNLAQEILCKRLIPDEEEANGRRRSDASRREPASLVSDSGDLFNQDLVR